MSATGIVFDIKQLAVFDGPGIRTTVFMKGCPLRCRWCHNPEGLSFKPQLMVSKNSCIHCGKCTQVCHHQEHCVVCGKCVHVCPLHLRRIAGTKYTAESMASLLLRDKDIFEMNNGGITLSGGEPTAQPEFIIELLQRTKSLHRCIETSGYCQHKIFSTIIGNLDFIIMDLKIIDSEEHHKWIGVSNEQILENFEQVRDSGKPFIIRIPLIPNVTDLDANLEATAKLVRGSKNLQRVELLPYHQTAGAKYEMVMRKYDPGFDTNKPINKNTNIFKKYSIPVCIL